MDKIEAVKALLNNYRSNKALYEKMLSEMMKYEVQLMYHRTGKIESREEIIEALCLQASTISDMPHSVTNNFNSITENASIGKLNYLYYLTPSPLEIKALEDLINEKKPIYEKAFENVQLVENLMMHLSEQQRFIIDTVYVRGYTISEAMLLHRDKFPAFGTHVWETFKFWIKVAIKKMSQHI